MPRSSQPLVSPPRNDSVSPKDAQKQQLAFSPKETIEALETVWKRNISSLMRIGSGLKIQWNILFEMQPKQVGITEQIEPIVLNLLTSLEESVRGFAKELSLFEKENNLSIPPNDYQHHHEQALTLLGTNLIPNIFPFVIAPYPSDNTQAHAVKGIFALINEFSSRYGDVQPTLQLVTSDDWDGLVEEHSLREAMEVAVAEAAGVQSQTIEGKESLPRLEVLSQLLQLMLLLVSVSQSFAMSILCESKTGLDDLVRVGLTCLKFHNGIVTSSSDSHNQSSPHRVETTTDTQTINSMTCLCHTLCILHNLCQIPDAGHLLVSSQAHLLLAEVVALPSRSSLQASPASAAGIATAHGLALQLLSIITPQCLDTIGPYVVNSLEKNDSHDLVRSIVVNIISRSPFAEVIEAGLIWLHTLLKLMAPSNTDSDSAHLVGKEDELDVLKNVNKKKLVYEQLLDRHKLLHVIQEVIQRHLTANETDIATSSPNTIASGRCCATALMCLFMFITTCPWQLQVPHVLATRHKTLLGLLITIVRKHRLSATGASASPYQYLSNVFSVFALGSICILSVGGRESIAALLTTPHVMGSGRGASSSHHTSQTISNLWSDIERYLASASAGDPSLDACSLYDEQGTEIPFAQKFPAMGSHVVLDCAALQNLTTLFKVDSVGAHLDSATEKSFEKQPTNVGKCADIDAFFWFQECSVEDRHAIMAKLMLLPANGSSDEQHLAFPIVCYGALHKVFSAAGDHLALAMKTSHPSTLKPQSIEATQPLIPKILELAKGDENNEAASSPAIISSSPGAFNASMTLITSLAHHYVGNVLKLRKLESSLARKSTFGPSAPDQAEPNSDKLKQTMLLNHSDLLKRNGHQRGHGKGIKVANVSKTHNPQVKVLFSPQAQSTRCWSVRDVQPNDIISLSIPISIGNVLPSEQISEEAFVDVTQPDFRTYHLDFILAGFGRALQQLHKHLCFLQEELERCPISRPSRRCFLNDLFSNVYPKIVLFIDGIAGALGAGNSKMRKSSKTAPNPDTVGRALFLFVTGEKQSVAINDSNLLDVYHFVLQNI